MNVGIRSYVVHVGFTTRTTFECRNRGLRSVSPKCDSMVVRMQSKQMCERQFPYVPIGQAAKAHAVVEKIDFASLAIATPQFPLQPLALKSLPLIWETLLFWLVASSKRNDFVLSS